MTRAYSRGREKLREAVYWLAVDRGDVRARLSRVYPILRRLSNRDLPVALHERLRAVKVDLTRFGPETYLGEIVKSAVDHTMSRIRNVTGSKIAARILALERDLESLQ